MAYNVTAGNKTADYGSGDLSAMAIDGLGQLLVAVIGFAAIIGLVILYRWFKGKNVKFG